MEKKIVMPWPEWKIEKLLGRGSFGEVYQVVKGELGAQIRAAVKIMRIPADNSEVKQMEDSGISAESYLSGIVGDITNEIMVMQTLKGAPNIVSIDDYEIIKDLRELQWTIYIRMELLTDLNQYRRKNMLTYEQTIRMGCDLCNALEICRKKNIIHRDIKPSNIFISQFGEFKLGDFGISKHAENTQSDFFTRRGTYSYMAPEIYKGERYDYSIDLYSLGVVLYQMANNGRLPFYPPAGVNIVPDDAEQALKKRNSGTPFPDPANGGKRLGDILRKACNIEPPKRYHSPFSMRDDLKKLLESTEDVQIREKDSKKNEYKEIKKTEGQEKRQVKEMIRSVSERRSSGQGLESDKYEAAGEGKRREKREIHASTIILLISLLMGISLIFVAVKKNGGSLLAEATLKKQNRINKVEETKKSDEVERSEEKQTEHNKNHQLETEKEKTEETERVTETGKNTTEESMISYNGISAGSRSYVSAQSKGADIFQNLTDQTRIIAHLTYGTDITIEEISGSFGRVTWQGKSGWVDLERVSLYYLTADGFKVGASKYNGAMLHKSADLNSESLAVRVPTGTIFWCDETALEQENGMLHVIYTGKDADSGKTVKNMDGYLLLYWMSPIYSEVDGYQVDAEKYNGAMLHKSADPDSESLGIRVPTGTIFLYGKNAVEEENGMLHVIYTGIDADSGEKTEQVEGYIALRWLSPVYK